MSVVDNQAELQIGFLLRLLPLLRLFQNWHISTTIATTNDSGRIVQRGEGTTMKETPQEYIQRMLGYTGGGENPAKVQAATAKKLAKLIKGVPAAKLKKRPAPEKWSVQEIVAHLADTEIVGSWRIRAILGAPGTPIQAFDQDAWVTATHYAKRDPRQAVPVSGTWTGFPSDSLGMTVEVEVTAETASGADTKMASSSRAAGVVG